MIQPVYNLSNGIDIEETRSKVEKHRKEHKQEIQKNRARAVSIPVSLEARGHFHVYISSLHFHHLVYIKLL